MRLVGTGPGACLPYYQGGIYIDQGKGPCWLERSNATNVPGDVRIATQPGKSTYDQRIELYYNIHNLLYHPDLIPIAGKPDSALTLLFLANMKHSGPRVPSRIEGRPMGPKVLHSPQEASGVACTATMAGIIQRPASRQTARRQFSGRSLSFLLSLGPLRGPWHDLVDIKTGGQARVIWRALEPCQRARAG